MIDRISYACKYTPLELLESFGLQPEKLNMEASDFGIADASMHANVCCHAKAVLQQAESKSACVFTDCCDSMRRVHDVLAWKAASGGAAGGSAPDTEDEAHASAPSASASNANSASSSGASSAAANANDRFLYFMELPHDDNGCAKARLAHELELMTATLEGFTGRAFDARSFIEAFPKGEGSEIDIALSLPKEPFFAIMGARATSSIIDAAKETLGAPVIDLTCASFRNIAHPPAELASASREQIMQWYAQALLEMLPCMRMCDVSNRRMLAELPNLAGIIYNTVKFCDYYGFDFEKLSALASVPILKMESDYQPAPAGQLSTRLEALRETAGIGNKARRGRTAAAAASPATSASAPDSTSAGAGTFDSASAANNNPENRSDSMKYFAGIDSGSTTTNMVALDADGNICASTVVRTGAKAERGAKAAFDEICSQLNAAPDDFAEIVATGYGRSNIEFATSTVTEITCHARGAHALAPQVRSIVDIGGQDSKIICLDENGNVSNFVMNDKCAAGTGRFLEAMARTVEMPLEEMARCGLDYKRDVTISSMCTVFAESEVISLIADNIPEADIIHGLNNAIASRTSSMASRAKASAPYMMTGGVARNPGVVAALEEALESELFVPENPDLCGALGAALFALDAK